MSRWAQFVAPGPWASGRPAEPARHRGQPARPTTQALSPRGAGVRQSLLLGAGKRRAAVHALRSAVRSLLGRCQQGAPRHGFRFKNKLYAVDASTIDLCPAAFPWASFRRKNDNTNHRRDDRRGSAIATHEPPQGPVTSNATDPLVNGETLAGTTKDASVGGLVGVAVAASVGTARRRRRRSAAPRSATTGTWKAGQPLGGSHASPYAPTSQCIAAVARQVVGQPRPRSPQKPATVRGRPKLSLGIPPGIAYGIGSDDPRCSWQPLVNEAVLQTSRLHTEHYA